MRRPTTAFEILQRPNENYYRPPWQAPSAFNLRFGLYQLQSRNLRLWWARGIQDCRGGQFDGRYGFRYSAILPTSAI